MFMTVIYYKSIYNCLPSVYTLISRVKFSLDFINSKKFYALLSVLPSVEANLYNLYIPIVFSRFVSQSSIS
jgi:hypothetical protein